MYAYSFGTGHIHISTDSTKETAITLQNWKKTGFPYLSLKWYKHGLFVQNTTKWNNAF